MQKSEVVRSVLYSLTVAVLLLLFLWQRLIFIVRPEHHHSGLTIPTSIDQDDFRKALDESAGFFDDMHQGDWQRLKERMRATPDCGTDCAPAGPEEWHQTNWEPTFTCQHERRVGRWGDGGKWVCDPHRITKNKPSCLVYSVGSENDFSSKRASGWTCLPSAKYILLTRRLARSPQICPLETFNFTPGVWLGRIMELPRRCPPLSTSLATLAARLIFLKLTARGANGLV